MTTSDSENFESADEDLDVNTNKPTYKKITEQKGNVDESSVKSTLSANDDENNMVKKTRTESTDDDFREPSAGEASNREKKKERPVRQPIERKPKQAMKLGVKLAEKSQIGASKPAEQSTSEIKKEATVEKLPEELKASSVPKKVAIVQKAEEDLSDNDWNDFDIDPKSEDSKKSDDCLAVKSDSLNVKPEKDKEEDGWDDGFEDWGEEDPKDHISSNSGVQHSDTEYKALADRLSSLGQGDTTPGGSAGGWGGWGGWGANLLTSGVSQLTSHVSQGFTTVSNVIESGMGAPDPEELVRIQRASRERIEKELKEEQSKTESSQQNNTSSENIKEDSFKSVQRQRSTEEVDDSNALGVFKFGKLVSSVTKLVETTGTAVVSGGLDTLEEIGKRTMRVIQGDEPGGRVQLSTLLREAKDRVDEGPPKSEDEDRNRNKKAPRFEALFDDFQGLVHLEALEMLSRQCDMKIKTLLNKANGTELIELKETLNQVKEICELPDPDDEDDDSDGKLDVETFRAKLQEATKDLGVPLSFEAILKCWEEILVESSQPLKPESDSTESETPVETPDMGEAAEKLSHSAISNLARCSALSVQLLHKSTALLSVRERRSTADEADGLTQLTAVLSSHIGEVAAVYSQKLHQMAQLCKNRETVNEFITNIFLEARKGSSYLQDAFLLTIPILQVGAT